eukprot:4379397-Amphidinium_carterae.1
MPYGLLCRALSCFTSLQVIPGDMLQCLQIHRVKRLCHEDACSYFLIGMGRTNQHTTTSIRLASDWRSCDCQHGIGVTTIKVGGELEMRPKMIVKHYLQTWFPMDALVLLVDWLGSVLSVPHRAFANSGSDSVGTFAVNATVMIIHRPIRRLLYRSMARRVPFAVNAGVILNETTDGSGGDLGMLEMSVRTLKLGRILRL